MVRRIAVVLVLVLVVGACGSSGEPNGFDQQLVPVADDLQAALGTDTDALPVVERNFLEACVLADTPRLEGTSNLALSCTCAYGDIVSFYRASFTIGTPEEIEAEAFAAFKELDNSLQDEGFLMPANIQEILDGCSV